MPLTPAGEEGARRLGQQLVGTAFGVCVHTRFGRTLQTAELVLADRDVPFLVEPGLDDVYIGELEGGTIAEYHAWKETHARADRFPGGESLDETAARYVAALRRVLALPHESALVVCHELPIRYLLNAGLGSDDLDFPCHEIPNTTPYLFDGAWLAAAVDRIEALVV